MEIYLQLQFITSKTNHVKLQYFLMHIKIIYVWWLVGVKCTITWRSH